MSTPAKKRLRKEYKRLLQDLPAGIWLVARNYVTNRHWIALIAGPDDTPWAGGVFQLTLHFREGYPNLPPTVQFVSPMFHPNVGKDGRISLETLPDQWRPLDDARTILTSIQSLLGDPNPNSIANSEAVLMFSENGPEYNRRVREIVEQY